MKISLLLLQLWNTISDLFTCSWVIFNISTYIWIRQTPSINEIWSWSKGSAPCTPCTRTVSSGWSFPKFDQVKPVGQKRSNTLTEHGVLFPQNWNKLIFLYQNMNSKHDHLDLHWGEMTRSVSLQIDIRFITLKSSRKF